jgi:electron transport complex protein RnfD
MENRLIVSLSPHIQAKYSVTKIMYLVAIALIPAWCASVYFFGFAAFYLVLIGIVSAVFFEWVIQKWRKVPVTAFDGSAALTGMLLSFNIQPTSPWWLPVIGSFVAIAIAKMTFGGLGYNPLNPALIGRAFIMASFPIEMSAMQSFKAPLNGTLSGIPTGIGLDAVTGSTPLTTLKLMRADIIANADPGKVEFARKAISELYANIDKLFFGSTGGVIGETSALLLILGGLFLILLKIVDWRIPLSYIGSIALFGWMFGGTEGMFTGNPVFQIFAGGVMLGAFFMATDMVTSPITKLGRFIFGIGGGFIAIFIRRWGGYPEGVCYSILLMKILVPLIDRYTKPRKFGAAK